MNVVQYARVSQEYQAQGERVSIDQQIADMEALCDRMEFNIVETFVDKENYKATKGPRKGKIVNPSGERADRPQLLKMLELVTRGDTDAVLCWRDDRLVRHPRVAVALEDALDQGDALRNGRPKIEIRDATGAVIDRFTLSIKATIWREENKRRAERITMGKVATLQQGRWPSSYNRLGYEAVKEEGKRGRKIVLAHDEEVQLVKDIFDWYESGIHIKGLRQRLVARSANQKGRPERQHDWSLAVIAKILRSKEYTGEATWRFKDGSEYTIEIPQIITLAQWKRVQAKLDRNKMLATRNAQGVYMLQNLLYCGDCDWKMSVHAKHYRHRTLADGTRERYKMAIPFHRYYCQAAEAYPEEKHGHPIRWNGTAVDWAVWRYIVDNGIKRPDMIQMQVEAQQNELREQGDRLDGDIAHARRKLADVGRERDFCIRQAKRGIITEAEFDRTMAETEESQRYWESEVQRLVELRDDAAKVDNALAYTAELMSKIQEGLPHIDQTPEQLKAMPESERDHILSKRRDIVQALCDKVIIWPDGRIKLVGVIDGSEGAQFELPSLKISLCKPYDLTITYEFLFTLAL